ncbi:MAG: L-lactate permease [Candidatus Paceibacterota bacterium]
MNNLPIILALIPFLFFVFFLLIYKTSLLKASLITFILYIVLAIFYWGIYPSFLLISFGKGFFVAFDILIIIFGAIFFLEILKDFKVISNISYYLEHLSHDYRVQIIVIAWLFEAFLEGTAGFGTPAAIAVPLLMGLGLSPIRALIVGLLGNSTAGVFGAAGTPITVGFAGLSVSSVPFYASLLNLVGLIVPIFMLWAITLGRENRKKEFFGALPFAIWSGIVFVVPSILFAKFWPEFPSILGSTIGIILVLITTKLHIFVPKESLSLKNEKDITATMSPFKSFLPYVILVLFLILGKIFLGKIGLPINLGFKYIFNLFNPGFAFILAGLVVAYMWKSERKVLADSVKVGIREAIPPFLVIVSMLAMVQVMINSGQNTSGLPSVITIIAQFFETSLLPFFAPFIGAFGGFITGSVTVSNILFGNLFSMASVPLGFNPQAILSLGVVGAAAGNMIALADILTAEAVVRVKNQELDILKGVFIPCMAYLILVGLIGMLFFGR